MRALAASHESLRGASRKALAIDRLVLARRLRKEPCGSSFTKAPVSPAPPPTARVSAVGVELLRIVLAGRRRERMLGHVSFVARALANSCSIVYTVKAKASELPVSPHSGFGTGALRTVSPSGFWCFRLPFLTGIACMCDIVVS